MDEHRLVGEDDEVTAGEERGGLHRRLLLGGMAAGAAGLLLPDDTGAIHKGRRRRTPRTNYRNGLTGPELRGIRIQARNRNWPGGAIEMRHNVKDGVFGKWHEKETYLLRRPGAKTFQDWRTWGSITFYMGELRTCELIFVNNLIGEPDVKFLPGANNKMNGGWQRSFPKMDTYQYVFGDQRTAWILRITRDRDAPNYKDFIVEFDGKF